MLVFDINPVAFKIGALAVRWYSLFLATGALLAHFFLKRFLKHIKCACDPNVFSLKILAGTFVGARLGYLLFYKPVTLFFDPLEVFRIWHGGLSFHGGLLGTVIAVFVLAEKYRISAWKIFDIASVISIFVLALGRLGNMANGMLVGTPFNGSWCVVFSNYDNVCRHPYPVYAFLSHILLGAYLCFLIYKNRKRIGTYIGSGKLAVNFLMGYGYLRIMTDIWKEDYITCGLKNGQWLSVFMVAAGIVLIQLAKRRNKN